MNKTSFAPISQFLHRYPLAWMLPLAAVLVLFPQLPLQRSAFWIRVLAYSCLYIILGLGLNIVVGFSGLLNLGYVAFYAIGAYTYALLASDFFDFHVSFWVVLFIGSALAALAGVLLSFPLLHLRGDYLAIVTLGFGEIVRILATNLTDLTNGSQGLIGIDSPVFFGFELKSGEHFYYLLLVVLVLVTFLTYRLNNSRIGRAWTAIREDEVVAQGMGVNTTWYKLLAFTIGAAIGGLGGVIFSAWQGSIFPDNFNLMVSVNVLCLIIIGGMGSIPGVILGGIILIAIPDVLREFSNYRMLLYGLLLVIMMIARPEGFIPSRRQKLGQLVENRSKEADLGPGEVSE
ncbi:MAG: hypothetical protein JXA25_11350 [Anaerolineales bacterium]|nr:hypothetical protein [Anaerolineales bacterium]